MAIHDYSNHSMTVFVGDTHGNIVSVIKYLSRKLEDGVIVICGDCGLGFMSENYHWADLKSASVMLKERSNALVMIRGNHDDPGYFDGYKTHPVLEEFRPVILLAKDYDVLRLPEGHTCLCVGGAVSVDRCKRVPGIGWWADEEVSDVPERFDCPDIDIVCTHTAPDIFRPAGKADLTYFLDRDDNLAKDLKREHETMDRLYRQVCNLPADHIRWIHGHYHAHYSRVLGNMWITGLDMYRNGIVDTVTV